MWIRTTSTLKFQISLNKNQVDLDFIAPKYASTYIHTYVQAHNQSGNKQASNFNTRSYTYIHTQIIHLFIHLNPIREALTSRQRICIRQSFYNALITPLWSAEYNNTIYICLQASLDIHMWAVLFMPAYGVEFIKSATNYIYLLRYVSFDYSFLFSFYAALRVAAALTRLNKQTSKIYPIQVEQDSLLIRRVINDVIIAPYCENR